MNQGKLLIIRINLKAISNYVDETSSKINNSHCVERKRVVRIQSLKTVRKCKNAFYVRIEKYIHRGTAWPSPFRTAHLQAECAESTLTLYSFYFISVYQPCCAPPRRRLRGTSKLSKSKSVCFLDFSCFRLFFLFLWLSQNRYRGLVPQLWLYLRAQGFRRVCILC